MKSSHSDDEFIDTEEFLTQPLKQRRKRKKTRKARFIPSNLRPMFGLNQNNNPMPMTGIAVVGFPNSGYTLCSQPQNRFPSLPNFASRPNYEGASDKIFNQNNSSFIFPSNPPPLTNQNNIQQPKTSISQNELKNSNSCNYSIENNYLDVSDEQFAFPKSYQDLPHLQTRRWCDLPSMCPIFDRMQH